MKQYQTGLTLRGDHYYCPLALQLSTYWNCEAGCRHCYLRRLNRTWGEDLRPLNIDVLKRQVDNALNKCSNSSLGRAIHSKKTIYLGAKSDPYQSAELTYFSTRRSLEEVLLPAGFTVVIATMFTDNLYRDEDLFLKYKDQIIIMPIVSPGLEKDWIVLERQKTSHPYHRLEAACHFQSLGFKVGVNGEPYIGGFHSIDDFKKVCTTLFDFGLPSYNTYNLHFNDWNAKQMHEGGIDIEKVWEENQDYKWGKVLPQMIQIAQQYKLVLGCPDFVNSGEYCEPVNTCCGIDVPNPCTFNLIHWKKMKIMNPSISDQEIIDRSWDGVGDLKYGMELLKGNIHDLFSLKDIKNGFVPNRRGLI